MPNDIKKNERVALSVSYDGSAYSGWQAQQQASLRTVQETLEQAISKIADQPLRVQCAGRTDAGVHASYQIVHFDSPVERDEKAWVIGAKTYLPPTIGIAWARAVSADFHARFSATARRYRYLILNTPTRPALLSHGVTWCHFPLDEHVMHQAAQHLLGKHDFSSFRTVACQAHSPVRTIHSIQVRRRDDMILIDVTANAFLHHMVRNIAGVLMKVGQGLADQVWVAEVLSARDRTVAAVTAPAHGLYLVDVQYPAAFALPVAVPSPYFFAHAW